MHYLSLSSLKLSIFNDCGKCVDVATGFFYENNHGDLFIITNWHVVTGRKPKSPSHSITGAIPTEIVFNRPLASPHAEGLAINLADSKSINLKINDADGKAPVWLEHPKYKYNVDVVALPISNRSELEKICPVNTINKYPGIEPGYSSSVMDAITVIGFPWGHSVGGVLPIYKRGSIASEPSYNHMQLPRFLIDCRTASSMSGSPVLVSHSGIWNPGKEKDLSPDAIFGTVENFVGVYSGRLISSDLGAHKEAEVTELGIVWRKDSLDEIVNSGVPGTTLDQLIRQAD